MFRHNGNLLLCQQGEQRLEQLIHERHHRLAMRESLGSLLIVVGLENGLCNNVPSAMR